MAAINISNLDQGLVLPLALLVAIAYPLYTLIYRLFFSPLSKIPGPWQTRISSLLEVNALKEQRRTQWVSELFEQNPGAVAVRTGPGSVSFNHPDAVKAIYGGLPILLQVLIVLIL
jgi:benzoate 4-monooxygenase